MERSAVFHSLSSHYYVFSPFPFMKLLPLLLLLTGAAYGSSSTARIGAETKMELDRGSITLKEGTIVDVVKEENGFATIQIRNMRGRVPLSAFDGSFSAPPGGLPIAGALPAVVTSQETDFSWAEAIATASKRIMGPMESAETLMVEGQVERANTLVLETFPEATRTPAEKFVLANVLCRALPKLSYQFHKEAVEAMPTNPDVLFEWALEQHRAHEYEAAGATYRAYSALRPDHAPAFGLAAECALRSGKIKEAIALWAKSECARSGTLEQLEALVCEVNGHIEHDSERMALMKSANDGDEVAAAQMLLLEMSWDADWWTMRPSYKRLKYDLPRLKSSFKKPSRDLEAAFCVAECALASERDENVEIGTIFKTYGFLIDANGTLPTSGKALSQMLAMAVSHRLVRIEEVRTMFGDRVVELARASNDREMYNVAAYLYRDTDRLAEIDQEGWDRTHDVRFAASRLAALASAGQLTLADPRMQRALQEFPQNSEIARIAVSLAAEEQKSLEAHLVDAIKAEYTRFSVMRAGADSPRPSAFALRGYFAVLAQLHSAVVSTE